MVKKNVCMEEKKQISKWLFLYLMGIVNPSERRIITMARFIPHQISLLCNYHLPLSLSQWQNWWVEYLEKYVSKSQRGKHLRGTPQWMRIWKMLIKQCHDLLPVTKHLLFQSQRLGFLENVSFGHSSVNFFASILVVTESWKKSRPPILYGLCQGTYIYLFRQEPLGVLLPLLY